MDEKIESDEIMQRITGQIFVGQGVLVAHEVGLFKLLASNPCSLEALSESLDIHSRGVQAMISSAAAMGLVEKECENYRLSKVGDFYFKNAGYLDYGKVLDVLIKEADIMNYSSVRKSILNNTSQVDGGKDIFANDQANIGSQCVFINALHHKAYAPAFAWTKKYKLDQSKLFIDLGCGSGIHSIAVCINNPELQVIACDRPPVLEFTKGFVEEYSLHSRISLQSIDFWKDDFPKGDVIFFGDIFHDWDGEKCLLLARKAFEKLSMGGQIILHEKLFNATKTGPFVTAGYNMKMLAWTEGHQYSFEEIEKILLNAGFTQISVIETLGTWSIIIGKKI
jgi:predicted nicotinamide N-methyase